MEEIVLADGLARIEARVAAAAAAVKVLVDVKVDAATGVRVRDAVTSLREVVESIEEVCMSCEAVCLYMGRTGEYSEDDSGAFLEVTRRSCVC